MDFMSLLVTFFTESILQFEWDQTETSCCCSVLSVRCLAQSCTWIMGAVMHWLAVMFTDQWQAKTFKCNMKCKGHVGFFFQQGDLRLGSLAHQCLRDNWMNSHCLLSRLTWICPASSWYKCDRLQNSIPNSFFPYTFRTWSCTVETVKRVSLQI